MNGRRRIAMVETKTRDAGSSVANPVIRWRFQLDNHLGSAMLEIDASGNVISYEEYHPYGAPAFHTADGSAEVSAKRYRYTGKERDDETGLYYHGARHYAAWLARWTTTDPAGTVDGLNLYQYALSSPINNSDPTGHQHLEQGTPDDPVVMGSAGGVNYFNIPQSRLEQLQREAALQQQLETAGAIASNPLSALFWGIAHWISGDPNKEAAAAQLGVATFGVAASVGAAGAQRDQIRSVAQAGPTRPVAAEVAKPTTAPKPTEPVPAEPPPPAPAPPPKPSPKPRVPAAPLPAAPSKPPPSSAPKATVSVNVPADPEVLEAKRSAAAKALAPLKEKFPDAVVGFRGSLARGAKGAHKGGVPFDPKNFDVDAFVVSDELAAKVPANSAGFRNLARLSEFTPLVSQVGRTIKGIGGVRTSDAFKVRVYSKAEFSATVGKDERYIVR